MSDRQELVILLREVMRWEKRTRHQIMNDEYFKFGGNLTIVGKAAWDDLADILNRAHVAISMDSRRRVRQRPQRRC